MAHEGQFIWYELMTRDTAAAADFYASVIGWKAELSSGATAGGMPYTIFSIPGFEMGTAGMMKLTPEMVEGGARPTWVGYVGVDDVDAKASAFGGNGGKVHMPGTDIPGIGRFAVVSDPQGALLYLFKPIMPDGPMPDLPLPGSPGTVGWNELYANDAEQAFLFYSKMFGWERSTGVDMGQMGIYQLFSLGGRDLGGMMNKPEAVPAPFWNFYFTVPKLDQAIEKMKAKGGTVINGPHQVPGGAWIVQAFDLQGAMFSLTAGER